MILVIYSKIYTMKFDSVNKYVYNLFKYFSVYYSYRPNGLI